MPSLFSKSTASPLNPPHMEHVELSCKPSNCKTYHSFHNVYIYCLVVNNTTVDYSTFWCNCLRWTFQTCLHFPTYFFPFWCNIECIMLTIWFCRLKTPPQLDLQFSAFHHLSHHIQNTSHTPPHTLMFACTQICTVMINLMGG